MNSNQISKDLLVWAQANTSEIVVPNYYLGRYECDVMKISKAGQLTEYEIKTSRADFRKDAEKAHRIHTGLFEQTDRGRRAVYEDETKHQSILKGKRCNRFYFVVPKGLIAPDEVPDGLGLIYAEEFEPRGRVSFTIVKMSKLHRKEPCEPTLYRHIACNLTLKLAVAKRRAHTAEAAYRALQKGQKAG